jgi:hypothetical protein
MRNKLTLCTCKNGIFKIICKIIKERKKLRRENVTRKIHYEVKGGGLGEPGRSRI